MARCAISTDDRSPTCCKSTASSSAVRTLDGGRGALQLAAHGLDRLGPQQLVEGDVLEQVLQQVAVDGQHLELLLGAGRVPLVHVDVDKVIEQALRHRRGGQRLDDHHLDLALLDAGQDLFQVRQVEHVLQAVAIGLGDDRKVVELAHHLQQVPGPQALQPKGRALAAPHAGQQQRALPRSGESAPQRPPNRAARAGCARAPRPAPSR